MVNCDGTVICKGCNKRVPGMDTMCPLCGYEESVMHYTEFNFRFTFLGRPMSELANRPPLSELVAEHIARTDWSQHQ